MMLRIVRAVCFVSGCVIVNLIGWGLATGAPPRRTFDVIMLSLGMFVSGAFGLLLMVMSLTLGGSKGPLTFNGKQPAAPVAPRCEYEIEHAPGKVPDASTYCITSNVFCCEVCAGNSAHVGCQHCNVLAGLIRRRKANRIANAQAK